MKCPCDRCRTRKLYAKKFDTHFSGEDCPYICKKYDAWKEEKSNKKKEKEQNK